MSEEAQVAEAPAVEDAGQAPSAQPHMIGAQKFQKKLKDINL